MQVRSIRMRAIVCVKRVVDHAVKIRVNAANTAVELNNVKMSMNPFCEIAVEEAVRLKEAGKISQIIAVSMGNDKAQETLRNALAMGVDEAIHIKTDARTDQEINPLNFAKAMKAIVEDVKPDVVLMGKQAIDDDLNQSAQMLAGILDWPQATFASKIGAEGANLIVEREVDAGMQAVQVPLPAVVSCDLRLNTPRSVTLPNVMKAKKKPLKTIKVEDLKVDMAPRMKTLAVNTPPKREAGVKVESVDELINKLKTEAKVIV